MGESPVEDLGMKPEAEAFLFKYNRILTPLTVLT